MEHTETTAHTEEASHEAETEQFYLEPVFWVAFAFVVFAALAFRPIAKIIAKGLDAKSKQIADELAEARRLRAEAQELLASYQKKQRDSLKEAEGMLEQTRADAAKMLEKAETELKLSLEKRKRMAEETIARAEAKAVQEMEALVMEVALEASKKIIVEHMDNGGNDALVRAAVDEAARKIH